MRNFPIARIELIFTNITITLQTTLEIIIFFFLYAHINIDGFIVNLIDHENDIKNIHSYYFYLHIREQRNRTRNHEHVLTMSSKNIEASIIFLFVIISKLSQKIYILDIA